MKTLKTGVTILIIFLAGCSEIDPELVPTNTSLPEPTPTSTSLTPNLSAIPDGAGWTGTSHNAMLIENDGSSAIEFDGQGINVILIEDLEFTNGTIEFDAKGKSEPIQNGFIGIAFRATNQFIYDTIYFRTFNFRAEDSESKSHAVQYMSAPLFPWNLLRAESPGEYEKPIDPAPDGDEWFHAKIVLDDRLVSVYVNGAEEPSLVVTELSDRTGGSVGLWASGYGVIANLQITPAK